MHVAVTGSNGLIGSALVAALEQRGDTVRRIVRSRPEAGEIGWDIDAQTMNVAALEGVDAVVHLAGEGIATKRWNDEQKRRILESRTKGTTLLARTLASLERKPQVLVSASGINYYGDSGDEILTEASPNGGSFLSDVCRQWEAATAPAADAGIRVAIARNGVVLSGEGGALAKMLPLFRFGVGGRLGSGKQWFSWIGLDDEVGALLHLLDHDLSGPHNLTAPNPVTNAELTKTLGAVLHRPTVLPTPAFGPKLVLGSELATELLFTSLRVVPAALEAGGYVFVAPRLEDALRSTLAA